MPSSIMPSIAITTTMPANSTARPDVSSAISVASRTSRPRAALEPEAVEDQQRVVDADADPDHRRQLRRPVDDVEHARADHGHQREAHDHREQGVEQRQAHRDHAERQEQHDRRHEEAEDLAGAALLGGRPVDDVAAERHLDAALAVERERVLGHRLDRRGVDVAGALAELDLRERDPAVLGDRARRGRTDRRPRAPRATSRSPRRPARSAGGWRRRARGPGRPRRRRWRCRPTAPGSAP